MWWSDARESVWLRDVAATLGKKKSKVEILILKDKDIENIKEKR